MKENPIRKRNEVSARYTLCSLDSDRRSRIPPAARALLAEPFNEFLFSAVNIWEIALKRARERTTFPYDPGEIRAHMLARGYVELPLLGTHATFVNSLPPIHKDPFDRILIAQAVVEGVTFVTADRIVGRYPGPILKV